MLRTLKNLFKQDREKFVVPKSVQNVIPIKTIWEDGIFLVGRNKYAKTFKFEDINYAVASREDKEAMFLEYSELLNSLDSGATTKITINNRRLNKADFEQTILIPMADDGLDKYRKEYNKMLLDKATGANSIVQDKYVTVSVCKKNIEEARNYFARVGADLIAHFNRLGSKCVELDAGDKLRIFHDFYRTGEETVFHFDITQMMRKGHDFKDFICPDTFEFESDCFRMGDRYGRVIFLREYAAYIKDSMVAELCELNRNMMLSVDIIPVPTDEAVREVENRLLGVETNITNWQRKQNQNNNFSAVIPYDLEQQRKESKEFLDDLTTRDQRMMFAVLTMVHTADSKEQLDNDTEALLTTARKHLCQFAVLKYQQMDGLNTALPFGVRKIDALRTLTTESLAVFIPFRVQEIYHENGVYYGQNVISKNMIIANRRQLLNGNSFILGVSGAGKSFTNPYFYPYDAEHNYQYDYDILPGDEPDLKRGFNIFEERENTDNETIISSFNSIFDTELRFNDQWKLSSQVGIQWDQSSQEQYVGENTFNMRNIREDSSYDENQYIVPKGGMHTVNNATTSQITWKVQGEYKNTFNDIHDIQIMAGSEIRKNWYNTQFTAGYGYDPKTLTTKPLNIRNDKDAEKYKLHTKTYQENAFASFYTTGSYSFMSRYTIGGSVRMDGSDLFGVDKKYRYLPIYSISGMWRASNEPFIQRSKWIDNLAIRLSYGLQGNIDKTTSPFLVGSYDNVGLLPGYDKEQTIQIEGAPNSKLRWEKTASYNLGLDFSVLNQAINLSVDYYYRKGTDLIGKKLLPLENGFETMTINWASMENKGVEINLQTRNITTKKFSWYTTFNFAYNQNKVLKINTPDSQETPSLEGYPVGAIFTLKTDGIDSETGRIRVKAKNGKSMFLEDLYKVAIDEWGIGIYTPQVSTLEEREFYSYIGTSDAPYTGGFMNTFNYKSWELNLNFSYNFGAYVKTTPSYSLTKFDASRNTNRDILDRWTPENKNGKFPAILTAASNPAEYSLLFDQPRIYNSLDIWVKKLNYIRLQNIRLAYQLPSKLLNRININGATVAVEARNLFVFGSSYKNYLDPESMGNLYATPIAKSVTFNLSLNF